MGLKNTVRLIMTSALAGLLFLSAGCATLDTNASTSIIRAKERVSPALVHIRPIKSVFAGGEREEMFIVGSGFIISPDGYIITNEHVAGDSSRVKCVLSDKREVEATVVGADPETDVAVLKLDVAAPLPHVRFGDSDTLRAGEVVLALGSPHGLARSVSFGIVSVPDRYIDAPVPRAAPYNTFIQTDAAINPGNSGGPLVNLRGEVVGVNARILRGAENVGFAIPINTARSVAEAIIAQGRVVRSSLGLRLQEMLATTDDPSQRGVLIADVAPRSPAAESGIRPGDVLVAINGDPVHARFPEDLPAVRNRVAGLSPLHDAVLTLQRGGARLDVTARPVATTATQGERVFDAWGLTARDVSREAARMAGLTPGRGVMVSGTRPGSPAREAGLAAGDIVLEVDDAPVTGVDNFAETIRLRAASGQPLVMLWVQRGALTRFVLIEQVEEASEATEGAA